MLKSFGTIRLSALLLALLVVTACATAPRQDESFAPPSRQPASCNDAIIAKELAQYYQTLNDVTRAAEPVRWPSRTLRAGRVTDRARVAKVMNLVLNDDPELMKEMNAFIADLGGMTSPKFWNKYFQSYDRTVGMNESYIEIFLKMSSHLPAGGRILDAGSGTGNGSYLLTLLSPARRMLALDISDYGLSLATKKVRRVRPDFETRQQSLLDLNDRAMADGAFMNNVLYTLPDKAGALRIVFEALKPGARFVLSDPKPSMALSKEAAQSFAETFAASSLDHGSEMTEFDMALVSRLNFAALLKPMHFLTPEQLADLAKSVGFEVESQDRVYYGSATLLVLRKPSR